MSPTDSLGVPWLRLAERLDSAGSLAHWAMAEPALSGINCVDDLATVVHDRQAPARSDAVLGTLVRMAAADGGDDEDAALLVAHLLGNGATSLAVKLRDLSRDIDEVIAGALWIKIRTFPWRRRTRAFAKSLLLDTRAAVLAELCPYRGRAGANRVVLREPQLAESAPRGANTVISLVASDIGCNTVRELVDLLEWAQASGALGGQDVALLLDLVAAAHRTDDELDQVQRRGLNIAAEVRLVAAWWGVNEKTVRRRRDRALGALREVRDDYFAAVA
jgi:hypothetical protein